MAKILIILFVIFTISCSQNDSPDDKELSGKGIILGGESRYLPELTKQKYQSIEAPAEIPVLLFAGACWHLQAKCCRPAQDTWG